MKKCDEFKNSLIFLRNWKTVKKRSAFDMPRNKLHSHIQFSADFMNSTSSVEFEILCRGLLIEKKQRSFIILFFYYISHFKCFSQTINN
jgi:hypothetical protein